MGFTNRFKKMFKSEEKEKAEEQKVIISTDPIKNKVNNFKYLENLIRSQGRDVLLDSDIILEDGEELQYADGIELDIDRLVLDASDYVIDGRGKSRIFSILSDVEVKLVNVSIKNGYHPDGGGAIKNAGNLTLDDCNFKKCASNEGKGGAIYNEEELVAGNCVFENNSARYGGAIYDDDAGTTVAACGFVMNKAERGGAISNKGYLSISESSDFWSNSADYGGAVYIDMGSYNDLRGGASFDSFFEENASKCGGGAIYNNNVFSIEATSFKNNKSPAGGAIYNDNDEELFISGSTFNDNSSQNGGAIYNSEKSTINMENSSFENNSAEIAGGGAVSNNGFLTIQESKFNANSAEKGGAIYNDSQGDLKLDFVNFNQNTSKSNGGAVYNNENAKLAMKESKFLNCSAECGGAIFNNGFSDIEDSAFEDNASGLNGGAIYNAVDGQADVEDGEFLRNSAECGGAIYSSGELTDLDSTFECNSSKSHGGAIYSSGDLTADDSTFDDNEPDDVYEE